MQKLEVRHNTKPTADDKFVGKTKSKKGTFLYKLRGLIAGLSDDIFQFDDRQVTFYLFLKNELPESVTELNFEVVSEEDGTPTEVMIDTGATQWLFSVNIKEYTPVDKSTGEVEVDDEGNPVVRNLKYLKNPRAYVVA